MNDIEEAHRSKTNPHHLDFQKAIANFSAMFPYMDRGRIEDVLRSNNGSVDMTIDHLLRMGEGGEVRERHGHQDTSQGANGVDSSNQLGANGATNSNQKEAFLEFLNSPAGTDISSFIPVRPPKPPHDDFAITEPSLPPPSPPRPARWSSTNQKGRGSKTSPTVSSTAHQSESEKPPLPPRNPSLRMRRSRGESPTSAAGGSLRSRGSNDDELQDIPSRPPPPTPTSSSSPPSYHRLSDCVIQPVLISSAECELDGDRLGLSRNWNIPLLGKLPDDFLRLPLSTSKDAPPPRPSKRNLRKGRVPQRTNSMPSSPSPSVSSESRPTSSSYRHPSSAHAPPTDLNPFTSSHTAQMPSRPFPSNPFAADLSGVSPSQHRANLFLGEADVLVSPGEEEEDHTGDSDEERLLSLHQFGIGVDTAANVNPFSTSRPDAGVLSIKDRLGTLGTNSEGGTSTTFVIRPLIDPQTGKQSNTHAMFDPVGKVSPTPRRSRVTGPSGERLSTNAMKLKIKENEQRIMETHMLDEIDSDHARYLEDQRLALMMQNEEFLKELKRNEDFMRTLEFEGDMLANRLKGCRHRHNSPPLTFANSWDETRETAVLEQREARNEATGGSAVSSILPDMTQETNVSSASTVVPFTDKSDDVEFKRQLKEMGKSSRKQFVVLAKSFFSKRRKKMKIQRKLGGDHTPSMVNLLEDDLGGNGGQGQTSPRSEVNETLWNDNHFAVSQSPGANFQSL